MATAQRLYQVTKQLPESVLEELLDFAEFLRQRKSCSKRQPENIAKRIRRRFNDLGGEALPIPERQVTRLPPRWDQ
jgi:hypothetical protein